MNINIENISEIQKTISNLFNNANRILTNEELSWLFGQVAICNKEIDMNNLVYFLNNPSEVKKLYNSYKELTKLLNKEFPVKDETQYTCKSDVDERLYTLHSSPVGKITNINFIEYPERPITVDIDITVEILTKNIAAARTWLEKNSFNFLSYATECSTLNEEIKKLLLPASETDAFKVIHTFTSTSNFSLENFYKKFNT